jgi:hypothetical protein
MQHMSVLYQLWSTRNLYETPAIVVSAAAKIAIPGEQNRRANEYVIAAHMPPATAMLSRATTNESPKILNSAATR